MEGVSKVWRLFETLKIRIPVLCFDTKVADAEKLPYIKESVYTTDDNLIRAPIKPCFL